MILYTSNPDLQQLDCQLVAIPQLREALRAQVELWVQCQDILSGRENLSTGDGTFMGTKFTINVTGTAVIQSVDDGQDITIKGQRQSRVMGEGYNAHDRC